MLKVEESHKVEFLCRHSQLVLKLSPLTLKSPMKHGLSLIWVFGERRYIRLGKVGRTLMTLKPCKKKYIAINKDVCCKKP